jgi:hypothetical protein
MNTRTIIVLAAVGLVTLTFGVRVSAVPLTTSAQSDETSRYGADSPGVIAPVGASERLPAEAALPPGLASAVDDFVSRERGSPQAAVQSLRKLQSGLSLDESTIYTFSPDGEAACFVIWKRTAVCPSGTSTLPGVLWSYNGGYPATIAGIERNVPSAIAGIFADNVASVRLLADGKELAMTSANNSFFAIVPASLESETREFSLRVTYTDGSSRERGFANPNS